MAGSSSFGRPISTQGASSCLVQCREGRSLARELGSLKLAEGSWFEALPAELRGKVALVVSNPPYVSEAEWTIWIRS